MKPIGVNFWDFILERYSAKPPKASSLGFQKTKILGVSF